MVWETIRNTTRAMSQCPANFIYHLKPFTRKPRLQKRAVKVVFDLTGSQTCRSVFRNKNLFNFTLIYILESVTLVKDSFFVDSLQIVSASLQFNRNTLSLTRSRATFNQNQFSPFCARLFNTTPPPDIETETESISM